MSNDQTQRTDFGGSHTLEEAMALTDAQVRIMLEGSLYRYAEACDAVRCERRTIDAWRAELDRRGVRQCALEIKPQREMYRGYEIAQSDYGWFNIRRKSFGVASFHTAEEARKAVDKVCDAK